MSSGTPSTNGQPKTDANPKGAGRPKKLPPGGPAAASSSSAPATTPGKVVGISPATARVVGEKASELISSGYQIGQLVTGEDYWALTTDEKKATADVVQLYAENSKSMSDESVPGILLVIVLAGPLLARVTLLLYDKYGAKKPRAIAPSPAPGTS